MERERRKRTYGIPKILRKSDSSSSPRGTDVPPVYGKSERVEVLMPLFHFTILICWLRPPPPSFVSLFTPVLRRDIEPCKFLEGGLHDKMLYHCRQAP